MNRVQNADVVRKARLVNLCNHDIVIGTKTVKPSGLLSRVDINRQWVFNIEDDTAKICVPVKETWMARTTASEPPPPEDGVYYIVSRPVAQCYPERDDLLVPDHRVTTNGDAVTVLALARFVRSTEEGKY